MARRLVAFGLLTLLSMTLATSLVGSRSYGDDAEKKPAAKKEREKAKGYLPPYYRDVIDGLQREKIYEIQKQYDAKIDALEAEAKALRDKRDAEIAALLSPEQKKRVQELAAEAKNKRDADAKAKSSAKAPDAAPKSN